MYNEIKQILRKRAECQIKNKYTAMQKITQNL